MLLKPNMLYSQPSMGEGETYITATVDQIRASFNYQFTGEEPANIKGDYEIVAVMEGYTGRQEKEQTKTIWKKETVYLPKTSFNMQGQEFSVSKNVSVKLEDYNNFISALAESTKINTQSRLSVIMRVNLKAETEHGVIEEKAAPAIIIPLGTSYFEIAKNEINQPGALEKTQKVRQPINKSKVAAYGVGLAGGIIALIYLIFFTNATQKDLYAKQLDQIFKKHGSRLVALERDAGMAHDDFYKVYSFEDLVRISDELGQPIMYKFSEDYKDISKFYVTVEQNTYLFDLKEYVNRQLKEQKQKKVKPKAKNEAVQAAQPATTWQSNEGQTKDI